MAKIKEQLTKSDMLKYFEEINRRLAEQNKFGELIIAGGAALALVYNARNSTRDIDAVFTPKENFRDIIKAVGNANNLKEDWLNDGVKGFFTDKMTASVYKDYGNLVVSSIDAACLLAMKLTSAREDTQDESDSLTLMKHLQIKNIDELFALMEKYAHPNQLTPKAKYFTIEVYEAYSKEAAKSKSTPSIIARLDEKKKKIAENGKPPKSRNRYEESL